MKNFEDMVHLFNCRMNNRGIIRQNFDEAALLWKAVKWTDGPILEIGRYHGGSTILIASAADKRRVVSIDKDEKSVFSFPENIIIIVDDSTKPFLPQKSFEKFGFIFIDGDHSYEGVLADTKAHFPELEIGGLILYHDAYYKSEPLHYPGVKKVCELMVQLECVKFIRSVGSSALFEKIKEFDSKAQGK